MRKAIAIAMILSVLAGASLGAQTSRGSGNLRGVNDRDFIFRPLQDPLLYPECAFTVNPAVLMDVSETILITDLGSSFGRSVDLYTRLDDTYGSIGGTYTAAETTFFPDLLAGLILPLGEKNNSPRFGATADFSLDYANERDEYVNYNAFSEHIVSGMEDISWNAGTDLFLAIQPKSVELGFSLGYGYSSIPRLFSVVSDDTLESGSYIDEEVRGYDEKAHAAGARTGIIVPLSRAAELSLALNYRGNFTDRADTYLSIDEDGDGYNETVISYAEYYSARAAKYESKDLTIGTRLTLHPVMRLYVSDDVEMFFSGQYSILDRSDRTYYQRVRYITDLTDDQSLYREITNASFTSFQAHGGFAVETENNGLVKFGIGYTREDRRFRQEGIGPAGANIYSRLNANNYTELSLGLEPLNNSIVSQIETPTEVLTQLLTFRFGYEQHPVRGPATYFLINVTGMNEKKSFHAYNLDTRSVWYEEERTIGLSWELQPVAGIAIKIGKKENVIWSINVQGTGTVGDPSKVSESAPYDTFLNRTTTNGEIDTSQKVNFEFEAGTGFLFLIED
jgi:hypothetical protein